MLGHKCLLKCAKAVGDAEAAQRILATMTTPIRLGARAPVAPDVEAFNHFLAVKCWQEKMRPQEQVQASSNRR